MLYVVIHTAQEVTWLETGKWPLAVSPTPPTPDGFGKAPNAEAPAPFVEPRTGGKRKWDSWDDSAAMDTLQCMTTSPVSA